MGKKKTLKTLYFITGVAATEEQLAEAEEMPGNVCFRNAAHLHAGDVLEDFDRVAGDVPEAYAKEADRKAAEGEDAPEPPKSETTAPGAPQNAKAAPAGEGGKGSGWSAN